jgi:hypothetical protein
MTEQAPLFYEADDVEKGTRVYDIMADSLIALGMATEGHEISCVCFLAVLKPCHDIVIDSRFDWLSEAVGLKYHKQW